MAEYEFQSNERTAIKNNTVLEKLSSDGLDLTATWLHNLSAEPKPSLQGLSVFLKRLENTHKDKKKSKHKQEKKGIAGQVGTYVHWLQEDCKLPTGQNPRSDILPAASTFSAPSLEPKAITRTGFIDIRDQLREEKEKNAVLASDCERLKLKLESNKPELKRVRSRESYYRAKTAKLESERIIREEDDDTEEASEDQNTQLYHENLQLKEDVKTLQDIIKEFELKTYSDTIETFDKAKKCYTPSFRNMVYKLLEEHVGLAHIGPVIETVLNFANRKVDKLPSETTYRNMNLERLLLAQQQLAEEFSKKKNTSLYSDETSKNAEKYMGFHATDCDKRFWVLGIRDLATKSADDTLKTFKEVLQDIDDGKKEDNTSDVAKEILANIQNTMSDRAATEVKWHEMLAQYRKEIIPIVEPNWGLLTEEEQRPIERLRNFYCGLHSYVQAAEVAGAALLELEKGKTTKGPQIVKANEPGAIRLIRTAAKAFARGADEKSGAHGDFMLYDPMLNKLKESMMTHLPIVPFRHNRFNIVFFNGGFIYFFYKEMKSFIEGRQNPNRLMKAVLSDLEDSMNVAGCKAFGLISKLLMGPLWRIIENNDIHVAEMGPFIKEILDKLVECCSDPEEFMNGEVSLSTKKEWVIKKDIVYNFMITPNPEIDDSCIEILKVVLPAITTLLKEHYNPLMTAEFDDLARQQTQSVVKHNKFSERVFAYTDQLLKFKPNISHISQEAYIMFCLNKTAQWLRQKNAEERKKYIEDAIKDAPNLHEKYMKRRKEIRETRAENLRKKIDEEERRKAKKMQEREIIFRDILYYGLYQNEEQLEIGMKNIKSTEERKDALKAQLRFREHILEQDADSKLFRFSEKQDSGRRNLSWQELKKNTLCLIHQACQMPKSPDETSKASFLIGKKIVHKLYSKTNENDETEEGVLTDYMALVISTVPGFPSWFNIKYDLYDDIYVEQLQQEMEKGNIKLAYPNEQ